MLVSVRDKGRESAGKFKGDEGRESAGECGDEERESADKCGDGGRVLASARKMKSGRVLLSEGNEGRESSVE